MDADSAGSRWAGIIVLVVAATALASAAVVMLVGVVKALAGWLRGERYAEQEETTERGQSSGQKDA